MNFGFMYVCTSGSCTSGCRGGVCWQLAHHEEKLVIMEQSLSTTQEQLSTRVSEVVKLEQTLRRQQTELKTMKERCASYEDEISEQKDTIGQFRAA